MQRIHWKTVVMGVIRKMNKSNILSSVASVSDLLQRLLLQFASLLQLFSAHSDLFLLHPIGGAFGLLVLLLPLCLEQPGFLQCTVGFIL